MPSKFQCPGVESTELSIEHIKSIQCSHQTKFIVACTVIIVLTGSGAGGPVKRVETAHGTRLAPDCPVRFNVTTLQNPSRLARLFY